MHSVISLIHSSALPPSPALPHSQVSEALKLLVEAAASADMSGLAPGPAALLLLLSLQRCLLLCEVARKAMEMCSDVGGWPGARRAAYISQ
jgi:hypothetical protein